jgi:hypothetical protein
VSKAKKIKVEKPDEPEKKMPEEQSVQPDQVDHTYGRKSDGGEVAMAESQFLRSLHEAAGRLLADPAGKFDHRAALRDTALMLSAGLEAARQEHKQLNVARIQEDLMLAMRAPDNPFVAFPLQTNINIYCEIVKFASIHVPDLLQFFMMIMVKNENDIDSDTVIQAAFLFTQMACAINPGVHSAYFKMLSVFLKACGLTDTGVLALSKLGVCEAPRTLLDTKDKLAAPLPARSRGSTS